MLPLEHPDRIQIAFDDHRLVNNAGLLLPATLAQRVGLRELVDRHLDLGDAPGRANAGDKLGFTHFKRRKRGNLQVGGIERWGVPACRGWLRTVKNPLTPATGGVAPGRWRPRRLAMACRTRPPCVGS